MDDFKKHKIKEKIKSKKGWIVGTGLFLLAGVIAWIIGCYASGANPVEWLTSPFAVTIYILIGLFLLFCGFFAYIYFISKNK